MYNYQELSSMHLYCAPGQVEHWGFLTINLVQEDMFHFVGFIFFLFFFFFGGGGTYYGIE